MPLALKEQIVRIVRAARRVGLHGGDDVNAEDVEPVYSAGHPLPPAFLWFCMSFPAHAGWPHIGWPGIYSPRGSPSAIDAVNATRREDPDWPKHLVSFFSTDDGDYCFAYDDDGSEPYVAYVDHWANAPADEDAPRITASREHVDFAEWFARQVDWLLSRETS